MRSLLQYGEYANNTPKQTRKLHGLLRKRGRGIAEILAEQAIKTGASKLNANLSDEAVSALAHASPGLVSSLFRKGKEFIFGKKPEIQLEENQVQPEPVKYSTKPVKTGLPATSSAVAVEKKPMLGLGMKEEKPRPLAQLRKMAKKSVHTREKKNLKHVLANLASQLAHQ